MAAFALLMAAAAGSGRLTPDPEIRPQPGERSGLSSAAGVAWTDSRSPQHRQLRAERIEDTRGTDFELQGVRLTDARDDVIEARTGRIDPVTGTLDLEGVRLVDAQGRVVEAQSGRMQRRAGPLDLEGVRMIGTRDEVVEAQTGRMDPWAGTLELGGRVHARIQGTWVCADALEAAQRGRTIRLHGRVTGLRDRMLFSADEARLSWAGRGMVLDGNAVTHFRPPPPVLKPCAKS